jgi:hypothetical protein
MVTMLSDLGSVGVSPYTEEDEAKTNRFTEDPSSLAAVRRFTVPWILTAVDPIGSFIDLGTDGSAA